MVKYKSTIIFLLAVLLGTVPAFASPNIDTMTVQGYMKLANGTAVADGAYTLAFGVFQNGTAIWGKSASVTITNGLFSQSMSGLGTDLTTLPAATAMNANYSAVTLNPALLQASAAGEITVRVYAVSSIGGNNPTFDIAFNAVPASFYAGIAKAVDAGAVTFAGIASGAYSSLGGASGLSGGVGLLVQYDNTGHLDSSVFNTTTPDVPAAAISGSIPASQIGSGNLTVASANSLSSAGGAANFDWSTSTGTFASSTGANNLNGDVTIASGKKLASAGGAANFDWSSSTGTFATGSGAVSMNGPVTLASTLTSAASASNIDFSLSTGTFATPSGANTINGSTTFAANVGISTTAGTGAFDFSNGSGIFKTSTGNATIGGTGGATSTTVQSGTGGISISSTGTTSSAVSISTSGASGGITLAAGTGGTITSNRPISPGVQSITGTGGAFNITTADGSGVILFTVNTSSTTITTINGCNSGLYPQGAKLTLIVAGGGGAFSLTVTDTAVATATADSVALNGAANWATAATASTTARGSTLSLMCTTINGVKKWVEVGRSINSS